MSDEIGRPLRVISKAHYDPIVPDRREALKASNVPISNHSLCPTPDKTLPLRLASSALYQPPTFAAPWRSSRTQAEYCPPLPGPGNVEYLILDSR